jgi:hypothetical protein
VVFHAHKEFLLAPTHLLDAKRASILAVAVVVVVAAAAFGDDFLYVERETVAGGEVVVAADCSLDGDHSSKH